MRSISSFAFALLLLCTPFASGQGVITTVAGTDWLFPADGLPAVNAPLSASLGPDLAVDAQGNLYVCDLGNAMVMRIGPDGVINVIAGNGLISASGDGGPAVNASLFLPFAIAVDLQGNLYISDSIGTIRKVTPAGIIRTIGGALGESGFSGDGGLAVNAQFDSPYGLAVDVDGTLYISDSGNYRIRKITPDGIVTTIAGTGVHGLKGDGGPAVDAQLQGPSRMVLDGRGNLYFVDFDEAAQPVRGVVRKIDANGIITTVAGGGSQRGDGIPATQSSMAALAVAVDAAGNLFIADRQTFSIRKVDTAGMVSTIAGSGVSGFAGDGGPALRARLAFNSYPGLAIDALGNVYAGDEGNGRVRRIDASGTITTFAGNGLFHFSGNGGPASSASLYLPLGIAEDAAGNLYITEATAGRIRRVSKDGTITVHAGNGTTGYSGDGGPATQASLSTPQGIAIAPDNSVLVAETANCVIRRIDPAGIITTVAGTGECGYSGDGGPAASAKLSSPGGLAVDEGGNLAITEVNGHRIRLVINGNIFTIAGTGVAGFSGDGGDSQRAQINEPTGIRLFGGFLYFSDSKNHRIRRIALDATRRIETFAGNGRPGFSGDDGPAIAASFNTPYGLSFDPTGNLFVADGANNRVRRIRRGVITTIVGGGEYTFDGVPSTLALATPFDVLVSRAADRLFFTDIFFNRVRAVLDTVPSFEATPKAVTLTAPAGALATDQIVSLNGSIAGVLFAATADKDWLQVTPDGGAMPASVTLRGDASKLTPGTYTGNILIEAIADPFEQLIPVTFTVTPPGAPSLRLTPASLQFSSVRGVAGARTRPISLANGGGGSIPFTIRAAMTAGETWLRVSPSSGTLSPFGSASVNITADPSGLAAGTYSATVTVSSETLGQSIVVPVTLTVSAVQQTILIPQTGLAFFATRGDTRGSVLPQFFSILNTGQGQMRWTLSGNTLSGGNWLNAFPINGVTDAAQPLVPQVRVDIDPSGLPAGVYFGTIQVNAPDADNSPQGVSIVLTVVEPGAGIGPIVQPSGLTFAGIAGAEPPGSQTVLIQNTSGAPVRFSSGGFQLDGKPIFELLPSGGTVVPNQPQRLVIQPKTKGLASGIYRGTLTLSFSDGTKRNLAVVLVLSPPGGAAASAAKDLNPRTTSSGCTPRTLVPLFTFISDGFTLPAAFPGQVTVKVIDDCATPMTTGGVTVDFSNGDPPVRLTSLKDGTWAGTWTPQRRANEILVTASAAIPEANLKGTVSVKGGLRTGNEPPVIDDGGIVNSASQDSQVMAPGSLVTLIGSKLADGEGSSTTTPLPTELANASVLIAGRSAPMLSASDGRLTAVVPFGITPNTTQQVVAARGAAISTPRPVIIAPAAPGVFTTEGTQGRILDASEKVAGPGNAAAAGDTVTIYCTGLGEVTPPVPAGEAAPATESRTNVPVTVTIGGVNAPVVFSGLAPGLVGQYHVKVTVPPGIAAGDRVPVVVTAAGQSSAPVSMAIR